MVSLANIGSFLSTPWGSEVFTMKINEKIAELVGIILGDGHIHTKNNLITIVGSLEDLKYYQENVIPLFEELFSKKPLLKKRKDRNSYYLMVYSKQIVNFLVEELNLRRGSKRNADIPTIIISTKEFIPSFLRGLFDTDGCLKFSRQNKKYHYYPRVQISLQKSLLAEQLEILFNFMTIPYGKWSDNRFNGQIYYQISGKENVERWFNEVSPKNLVHTTKYQFWKKYGYYLPKSSLEFRTKKLLIPQNFINNP